VSGLEEVPPGKAKNADRKKECRDSENPAVCFPDGIFGGESMPFP
jgi:hypothetical protein